ncbi:hypothetical protein E1J25_14060 [Xanthomonas hortorum pv. taraxaci]|nr:hypothetical protein [Xanthomonas hortorum pv. taraxaci]
MHCLVDAGATSRHRSSTSASPLRTHCPDRPLPRLRARARLHEWSTMHAFELPNCHDAVS